MYHAARGAGAQVSVRAKMDLNPDRALVRYEFMEVCVSARVRGAFDLI
jgi:hypothetical protein